MSELSELSKWSPAFWKDLAERTLASALYGVLTVLGLNGTTPLDGTDPQVWLVIVGIPVAGSLLKGILANLPGTDPSASAFGVTSLK